MSKIIQDLTTDTFKAALTSATLPVLVHFWAPWCGPCKAVTPTLNDLAVELEGKFQFAKVNVDENDTLATEYEVRAIPTMLIFKKGVVVESIIGMMPRANLKSKIVAHL